MAASRCPNQNCNARGFEFKEMKVWAGSLEKYICVLQCVGCGTAVGVIESAADAQRTGIVRGMNQLMEHFKLPKLW